MNFESCIGYVMANTGFTELLEKIYASNTVPHILSGKAVNRATRAHQLVSTVLSWRFIKPLLQDSDKIHIQDMLNQVLNEKLGLSAISSSQALKELQNKITEKISSEKADRTARLWLQYLSMVDLLRDFIRAERLGDLELHQESLRKMLPWFAAAGHFLYTKSVWIYLQQYTDLKNELPEVYRILTGIHAVHTKQQSIWNGQECDKAIECHLMKDVKGEGGLVSGTGFEAVQRNTFVFSRPACAEVTSAIEDIAGCTSGTSEQHMEQTQSRLKSDSHDMELLNDFFDEHDPFSGHKTLVNIVSGVEASKEVNIDTTLDSGNTILENMHKKFVASYHFKKSSKSTNMAQKVKMKVKGKEGQHWIQPCNFND